jgi:hypothetical protein
VLGVLGIAAMVTAISAASPSLAAPTITANPPNPSASTSASFSFSGPGGATFECKLDSGAYGGCTSPKTYSGLALGSHTFRVRGKKSGDTSPETVYPWSIVVPSASITNGPPNPTNSQSAAFTFTADASNATFECKLDGGSFAACSTPKSYSGLGAGSHTFQVRALGTAGTGAPASRTWTIDLTPPVAPTITSGPAASPAWTTTTSVSFTFTGEGGATFQCKLDSGSFAACSPPKPYSGLSQGSHTFQVKQTDTAGNTGPAASRTFQIDTVAPNAPDLQFAPLPWPPFGWSSTSATFAFNDASSDVVSYLCKLDPPASVFTACSSPITYTGLTQGQHTFHVKAVDAAGNQSNETTRTFFVDTVPPHQPNLTGFPSNPNSSQSATFTWTEDPDPAPGSGVVGFACKLDSGNWQPCSSPKTYNSLSLSSHTFQVVAIDWAGNTSTPATYTWTVSNATGMPFTISGGANGLLYPDVWRYVELRITNPNSVPIFVTNLTTTVTNDPNGCTNISNIELQQSPAAPAPPATNEMQVPANVTNWPVPQSFQPQIRLKDLPHSDQNNCKGQTFSLSYTGSAHS